METAKFFELALALSAFSLILIGGYLFARQSDRATMPRGNTR